MSYKLLQSLTSNQVSQTSESDYIGETSLVSVQAVYTDATPAADTFVDGDVTVGTDEVTITAHGFITGLLGQLTSSGTLPAGLALATDYFIIKVSDDVVKFASSYANAVAGTAVDITAAAGTGTHTFTPTALSAVVKLQASVFDNQWFDISGKTATITATGSSLFSLPDIAEPQLRVVVTQTSGQGVLDLTVRSFKKK